jgi:hypothetical protein
MWLVGHFKGEFAGMPFEGRSFTSYDPAKKKYIDIWVDSMAPVPMISEGTFDKEKKTLNMSAEYPGPDGKPMKMRSTTVVKDADTLLFTMYSPGPDGKEATMMTITYKRKK